MALTPTEDHRTHIFLGVIAVDGPPLWASGAGRFVLEEDYKKLEAAARLLLACRDEVDAYPGDSLHLLGDIGHSTRCSAAWKAMREALGEQPKAELLQERPLFRDALATALVEKFPGEPIEVSDNNTPLDPTAWCVTTKSWAKVRSEDVMVYTHAFLSGWKARQP